MEIDIPLDELQEIENLGVRTFNVCYYSNLKTLKDILFFFQENRSFKNLRNCGKKTEIELVNVCLKYKDLIPINSSPSIKIETDELLTRMHNLTIQQKDILNNSIQIKLNKLKPRAFNALNNFLKNDFSITNFYNQILSKKSFSFLQIKNIGIKSAEEFKWLISEIKLELDSTIEIKTEQNLNEEYLHSFLLNVYNIELSHFQEIKTIMDESNKIPIFKIVKVLIDNYYIFDQVSSKIFINLFDYYNDFDVKKSIQKRSSLNLTKERVRQIRNKIYDELNDHFQFLKQFNNKDISFHALDIDQDYICIDDSIVERICETERVNFNLLFINRIISIITDKTHLLIGNEKDHIFHNNNRFTHNWNQTYLISRSLVSFFDFAKLYIAS